MATYVLVRRPIQARKARWASAAASSLARLGVTPNQISVASVAFAALAAAALLASGYVSSRNPRVFLLLLAAGAIQLRLVCNLLDGMVAVEGGRRTKSGEVFNDLPDRIADPLILVAASYSIPSFSWALALGWAAALLAVLTAYVRVLGGASGLPQEFTGPMAKQHRMAVMTAASILAAVEAALGRSAVALPVALAAIVLGCIVTIVRRTRRIVAGLEAR